MRSLVAIIFLLLWLTPRANAEEPLKMKFVLDVADLMPDGIQVKGSSQGMAVWGRYAFMLHDGGQCIVIDLKKERYISSYMLEENTSHCNNASFGVEYYSEESKFPLLYISECRGGGACMVTDVSFEGSRLVQKIFYDGDDITGPCDWLVDREKGLIYLYCTVDGLRTMKRFRLPRLSESNSQGEVHLTKEDMIMQMSFDGVDIPQGSMTYRDLILLPSGVPTRSKCELHVIDLEQKQNIGCYSLDHIGLEPEGIAYYRGARYLSFHTPGRPLNNVIYKFRLTDIK